MSKQTQPILWTPFNKHPGTETMGLPLFLKLFENSTPKPFYNTIHYNMILDITQFKDGSQKCIDYIEKMTING